MARPVLAWVAAILAGMALGAASAWGALNFGAQMFAERYGAWTHNRAAGSAAAAPYTRAMVARLGLMALSAREALYFNLDRDDQGRPLDETCFYTLTGGEQAARWWSVTLYARDNFLAANSDEAHAIDASSVGSGSWSALVGPERGRAEHWLSSRNAGRGFSLTLRVYNPARNFAPGADTLPMLTRQSCDAR
jgi:hypothetical protein